MHQKFIFSSFIEIIVDIMQFFYDYVWNFINKYWWYNCIDDFQIQIQMQIFKTYENKFIRCKYFHIHVFDFTICCHVKSFQSKIACWCLINAKLQLYGRLSRFFKLVNQFWTLLLLLLLRRNWPWSQSLMHMLISLRYVDVLTSKLRDWGFHFNWLRCCLLENALHSFFDFNHSPIKISWYLVQLQTINHLSSFC